MKHAKKPKRRLGFRQMEMLSKVGAPLFKILYYGFITAFLLSLIVALIVFLVNTSTENILLPPLMTLHNTDYYSLSIGNGIRIDADYATVSLADIKTVIYAQLMMTAAFCAMMAPVSLFMAKLLKNIASGAHDHLGNARYTIYIGLSVMAGYTVVQLAQRFYNYLLVKTFSADPDTIHLSLGLDLGGVIVGLLIVLLGNIIGYSSEKHLADCSVPEEHTELTQKQ